jgi:hypothetical protein
MFISHSLLSICISVTVTLMASYEEEGLTERLEHLFNR